MPVATVRQCCFRSEERVFLPGDQVREARRYVTMTSRADVVLGGILFRNTSDRPHPVPRALPGRNARPGPLQVQLRSIRPLAAGLSARFAGLVGSGHASSLHREPRKQKLLRASDESDPYALGGKVPWVRLVIARCSVDYVGRLRAHLPLATRLLMVKSDGSVLVHSDGGSYKPLNWMSPPATLRIVEPAAEDAELGVVQVWNVQHAKSDDRLVINIHELLHESSHDLGVDPGLVKDGVEADLQRLLAEQINLVGEGYSLIRREYMTAIGPVDILARDGEGRTVAIELKRRGDIDGVEQLTRYLELLNRDPLMAPVKGVYAAQQIKPQARVLAQDRGIDCLTLDYDAMRGVDDVESRLF